MTDALFQHNFIKLNLVQCLNPLALELSAWNNAQEMGT
jgi:hypothetical protein